PDGIITEKTKDELKRVGAMGVHTVISTGRPFNGLPFDQITDTAIEYAITTNGAAIYRIADQKCLYDNSMPLETYLPILEYILSREIHIDIYIDGKGYTPIRCRENIGRLDVPESLRKYMISTRTPVEDLLEYVKDCGGKIQKINLNFYPQPDGSLLHREDTLRFLKSNPDITVVGGGFRNFEIGKAGVTKIEGIRELCKLLNVPMEQTMAIGDSENDYSMINAAGIGVAMANASEDILAIADYITTSNTEDGVGEAIKHFIP
ncbi:MAG: HAD hydrolase family protein, partial [Agathobacter sp.]|nr:HAD hydrolase family protein [Agathobacter sp.]